MDHVGAAILLAQPVVDRAGIQQQRSAIAKRVGGLQQIVRRKVGNDEAGARGKRCCGLRDVFIVPEPDFLQREVLIEEFARGVVVLDGKARAGKAVVLGRQFDERQFRLDAGAAEIADADLDGVGCEHGAGRGAQADRYDQPSEHGFSLTGLLFAVWRTV